VPGWRLEVAGPGQVPAAARVFARGLVQRPTQLCALVPPFEPVRAGTQREQPHPGRMGAAYQAWAR
jgi:hypothetical protein